MHLRQIRFVFMSALLLAATARAEERQTKKCNAPAGECERAIRSMASGRRYLGALVQNTDTGLRVASIIADSPAQRGGLGEGDRVMAINGRSLVRGDIKEFKRILSEAKETGRLSITVARGGILKKVDVWLEPYTKAQIDKIVAQHMAESHSQAATTQPQP
jgi:predicted metalloprotease with PDZ domain